MAPIEEKAKGEDAKGDKEAEAPEDPPVVKKLKEVDDRYLALEREYEKEVHELTKKYTEKQRPFLEQRKEILTRGSNDAEPKTGTPGLKGFWLKAMKHHQAFMECIQSWDEPVLEYLIDIEKADLSEDDAHSFKLTFKFLENPYFTNTELVKEYTAEETNPYCGEIAVKKIKATEIEWKAGKNVTVELVAKKVKGGGAKKAKQKKEKEEPRPSFFRDFIRNMEPDMKPTEDMIEQAKALIEDEEEEDDEEDDADMVEMLMQNDHEVGMALKDNIIPFAVRWYTGEAAPEDMDDDDLEDEEEEEESESDDESEDEDPKAKAKAKGKAGAKKKSTPKSSPQLKPSDQPKEECKQQ